MSIVLSNDQDFPTENLVLNPIVSDWDLMLYPTYFLPKYEYSKSDPRNTFFEYRIKPKSAYNYYVGQGFTDLKVQTKITLPLGDENWLKVLSGFDYPQKYTSENQYEYRNLVISIYPTLSMTSGLHLAKVSFSIIGKKNGIDQVLSSYDIPVELIVYEEGVFYSPNNFTFYKSTIPSVEQKLRVNGEAWKITTPKGFVLRSETHQVTQNVNGTFSAQGTSEGELYLNIGNGIDAELGNLESKIFPILASFGSKTYSLPANVIRTGNYYPTSLRFKIESGTIDFNFQIVHLLKNEAFTVSCSNWLNYEILQSEQKQIKVKVVDPSVFGSGEYIGFVKIHYVNEIINVPVYLSVGSSFDFGTDKDSVVFTHSMNDLEFKTENENSILSLILNIGEETNFLYQIPFFKKQAKKQIGRVLSRMITYKLDKIEANLPMNYFSIYAKEQIDHNVVKEFDKENIPFLLGHKPVVRNQYAILQHNFTSRFTKDSFALVSIMALVGSFQYTIEKNSEPVYSSNLEYGYIVTKKIDFSSFEAKEGDVFDFILLTDGEEIQKRFIIVPDPLSSIDVVYIDSFGLHASLNFTGNYKNVTTELTNKIEKFNYKSTTHSRKFLESESTSLRLNTGYLLRTQLIEIEELVKSEKAWIVVDGKKVLEIIPKTKELENFSSDDYLISYSVEFDINKNKYAQDYNFFL